MSPGSNGDRSPATPPDASKNGPFDSPKISLPKGGGAIRGMGEKFGANPVTGTGSMTVPIATSPGRSGFGPQLSLSYDSGAGNGPFGLGWSLSIPAITRKTDKGLPRYEDADESDVYILSGSEDLVPVLELNSEGSWVREHKPRTLDGVDYSVCRYRPRIESLFARIERWTRVSNGDIHWRSISKDNITTWYGKTAESRVADDADPSRIFSWLICQSYDDKGNAIVYHYAAENDANVDHTKANERNRVRGANAYLKRIQYGNRAPNRNAATWEATDPTLLDKNNWMFEVVFDYGEGHYAEDAPGADGRIFAHAEIATPTGSAWPVRQDPFSAYRPGFEVRTYRLCRRVLMFHHFPAELETQDYLVRATDFGYRETPIASFITSVTQSGFRLQQGNTYLKKSLPPLEFEYSEAIVQQDVKDVDGESLENLPAGANGSNYQWLDLDGEGLQCVLAEQDDAWYYKRNVSPITFTFDDEGKPKISVRFEPVTEVARLPSFAETPSASHQFLDLAGDGQLDCVVLERPTAGFFERTEDQDWEAFRPLPSQPNIDSRDPNLRFVDLTGDGHADILITEHECLTFYPSLGEDGFGPAIRIPKALDEEKGPAVVFADGTQSIFLADMSGDGLTDIVRIRNGEVCYWPNLGYGRFGSKVTMDRSPRCEAQDQFDPRRVRLADIDGSGVTDIIYLAADGVRLYFNQSGNAWSHPEKLAVFPQVDNLSNVQALDLLGNGTACLVWTSPLPGDARRSMRYVDLMGGLKPHLLALSRNNLGAETRVFYAPSTKFYLADREAGNPWVTRLGFPVHVVERLETYDRISRNRFVSRYAYHHGYFDGDEREFRGFGLVEQFDTEEIGNVAPDDTSSEDVTNWDAASFVPPVHTKTWFHTGIYLGREHVSDFFAGLLDANDKGECYREPGLTDDQARGLLLDDTVLPDGLTVEEEREACRALKGSMLRQEVYGLDSIPKAEHPYTVIEQNFTIERLQSQGPNQHAVFFTHPREALSYHYERNPDDPRIGHAMTLEVDDCGNVERSLAIGYPRRSVPDRRPEQAGTHITLTVNRVVNFSNEDDSYRTGLPVETQTYEMVKPPAPSVTATSVERFGFDAMRALTKLLFPLDQTEPDLDNTWPYEKWDWRSNAANAPGEIRLRLIERIRTLYRRDDLTGVMLLGQAQSLALPFESYKLAFTTELLSQVFQRNDQVLMPSPTDVVGGQGNDHGGYVDLEGDGRWWIPSGRVFFDTTANVADPAATALAELTEAQQDFFLPRKLTDPFGHSSTVDYDPHALLVIKTTDAVQNTVTAVNDYRVLQPKQMTDPNDNRSEAAFDTLGMVVATAVKGKDGQNLGDLLEGFEADPPLTDLQSFIADPQGQAASLLGKATTRIVYDLNRFRRCAQAAQPSQPPFAGTLARETHLFAMGDAETKIQIDFSYSDGFGREIQKKIRAEAGDAPQRQGSVQLPTGDIRPGDLVLDANGRPVQANAAPRWVGSGRTVFNNKGKPVRQYEPFFSATHLYEEEREMTDMGVSPVLFYDPAERVVATLHPNHTWAKVVFDPWRQETWDVNDTSLVADPKTDANVGDFFSRLPDADYLPPWHALRTDPAHAAEANERWPYPTIRNAEKEAAEKTAVHANTPTVAHFDTLGRTFLTVAHNKFKYSDTPSAEPPVEEFYPTRVILDIEGSQREVIDAKDRVVMRYDYDMLGNRIHQASMEAAERWMLNDVAGKPIRAWDSRDFNRRIAYDELRRPTRLLVTKSGIERLAERTVYGESHGAAGNHRTRVFQVLDAAGILTSDKYDFKGNLVRGTRDLLTEYKNEVDWQQNPVANGGSFTTTTEYDALNRATAITTPDNSTYRPTYNEANLLDKVEVNLRGATAATPFVTNIDYNEKGQRTLIHYANGAATTYEYDEQTFRLIYLKTTRAPAQNGELSQIFKSASTVQDLSHTYDPAGNIVRIEDAALSPVFFNQQQVEPVCQYTYDAAYRLIEATGREHIGQRAFDLDPPFGERRDYPFMGLRAHPNDLQALRNYRERYEYDPVGNFDFMRHIVNGDSWTRSYEYSEASLLEPSKQSNRLTQTTVGNFLESYTYADPQGNDVHGCMTSINSMKMEWDFKDQLQKVDLGGGGTACYVYDASGQRVRKVVETQSGALGEERLYLGGFEIYRKFGTGALVRETLHIMDDKQRIALAETKTHESDAQILNPHSVVRYQLGNHLGSAILELDKDGGLISYEEYHPYGTTAFQAMNGTAEVSLKRYRYTGKERDEETGLYYHGARYYAPWLGRWINCDPIGIGDGANVYCFARNSPHRYADPSGTSSVDQTIKEIRTTDRLIQEKRGIISKAKEALNQAEPALEQISKDFDRLYRRTQTLESGSVEHRMSVTEVKRLSAEQTRLTNEVAQHKELLEEAKKVLGDATRHRAVLQNRLAGKPNEAISGIDRRIAELEQTVNKAIGPKDSARPAVEAQKEIESLNELRKSIAGRGGKPGPGGTSGSGSAGSGSGSPGSGGPRPGGGGPAPAGAKGPSNPSVGSDAPPLEKPGSPEVRLGEAGEGATGASRALKALGTVVNVATVVYVSYLFATEGPTGVSDFVLGTLEFPVDAAIMLGPGAAHAVESRKPGCAATDSCANSFMGHR